MTRFVFATLAVFQFACSRPAPAAPEPAPTPAVARVPAGIASQVRLQVVATGLKKPVGLVFAPGSGRMYAVEQTGTIREVVKGVPAADPLLDVSARISTDHPERGLLGLAFHPKFAENGRLFVLFTDHSGDVNVVEFRVDPKQPDRVDPKSEALLFLLKKPYPNHNGGDLVFGPDGKLWIGTGDGGSANDPHGNGQSDSALLGKMLTLEVDSAISAPHVWAKGLRNPWRYTFDRKTRDIWIADVGQNLWEEVDAISSTAATPNFGWNVLEGTHCFTNPACSRAGKVMPVYEYNHKNGCSITGGYVYRGRALPVLDGMYFYSDYCTAFLRSFRRGADGIATDSWEWRDALDTAEKLAQVTSFGEDGDGELYVVTHDGTIRKFVPAPAAKPAVSAAPK